MVALGVQVGALLFEFSDGCGGVSGGGFGTGLRSGQLLSGVVALGVQVGALLLEREVFLFQRLFVFLQLGNAVCLAVESIGAELPVRVFGLRRLFSLDVSCSLDQGINFCNVTAAFEKSMGRHSEHHTGEKPQGTCCYKSLEHCMFNSCCLNDERMGRLFGQAQPAH